VHAQVLARAAEPSLDLVDDQEDAVLVADAAQALEVALGRRDVAALAEDGLDDERCRVARRRLLLEEELELRAGEEGGAESALGSARRCEAPVEGRKGLDEGRTRYRAFSTSSSLAVVCGRPSWCQYG